MTTLLEIISNAADEVGVPRPSQVVASTDSQVRMLLRMSNREGRELVKAGDWTVLQKLHTFTLVADQAEYALPADYSRLLRETEWDRSQRRPMVGPTTPQEWQSIKSGLFGTGVIDKRFRIFRASTGIGRSIYIDPTPTAAGDILAFEYISAHWCADTTGTTTRDAWLMDDDEIILDADLMTLGVIIRFKRGRGLDFASEAQEYEDILGREKGIDRPAPALSLSRRRTLRLLDSNNIPETGFGG